MFLSDVESRIWERFSTAELKSGYQIWVVTNKVKYNLHIMSCLWRAAPVNHLCTLNFAMIRYISHLLQNARNWPKTRDKKTKNYFIPYVVTNHIKSNILYVLESWILDTSALCNSRSEVFVPVIKSYMYVLHTMFYYLQIF